MSYQVTVNSPTDFQIVEGGEMTILVTYTDVSPNLRATYDLNYSIDYIFEWYSDEIGTASESDFIIVTPLVVNEQLMTEAGESFTIETVIVAPDDGILEGPERFTLELWTGPSYFSFDVTINDEAAIEGTSRADRFRGDKGTDNYLGLAGKDVLCGGGGEDLLDRGAGNDLVAGGKGNDIVIGRDGKDKLWGDAGDDALHGDKGDDRLWGGAGSDSFYFWSGRDVIEDFKPGPDGIVFDAALFGTRTPAEDDVFERARVVDGDVVIDFGRGDVLTISGLGSVGALTGNLFYFEF